jgi:glucosyl-3-phosphoglycerate synthase
MPRLFDHSEFDARALAESRRRRVSVCIPARNEAATVGAIVTLVTREFSSKGGGIDLVDEVIVVDDGSEDRTAEVARSAGADVLRIESATGSKGDAMNLAVEASSGDVVLFLDGDVDPFPGHFVPALLGPVLTSDVALVKAAYSRPLHGVADEGGRVNELTARPIIALLYPHIAEVRQPLAGETAVVRTVLEKVRLAPGYGVEMGLLIDVAALFGSDSIAQVDLGVRAHRNRPLRDLAPQATDVLRVALERAGLLEINSSPTGRPRTRAPHNQERR